MFKSIKKFCAFLIIFNLFIICSLPVFAEGSTTFQLSNKSPNVGDTIKVNVNGSESANITVTFNESILKLVDTSVDGDTTSNTFSFDGSSAELSFEAIAPGTSGIIISSDSLSNSSGNINVSGQANTQNENNNNAQDDEATDNTNTSNTENNNSTTEQTTDDQEAVEELIQVKSSAKDIVVNIVKANAAPSNTMVEAMCVIDEGQFSAYQIADKESDFYYFFGKDDNEEQSWYVYDKKTGLISRADMDLVTYVPEVVEEPVVQPEEIITPVEEEKNSIFDNIIGDKRLLIAICVFVVALIIVIIINLVLKRKLNSLNIEDDDDYYDDYNDEETSDVSNNDIEKSQEDGISDNIATSFNDITENEPIFHNNNTTVYSDEEYHMDSLLDAVLDEQEARVKAARETTSSFLNNRADMMESTQENEEKVIEDSEEKVINDKDKVDFDIIDLDDF